MTQPTRPTSLDQAVREHYQREDQVAAEAADDLAAYQRAANVADHRAFALKVLDHPSALDIYNALDDAGRRIVDTFADEEQR